VQKKRPARGYNVGASHLRVAIPPHIPSPPDRQPTIQDPSRLQHGPPSYRSPTVAASPSVGPST